MLIILAIIGGIVAILTASYTLQQIGKDKYHYSIFSIGGMGVSFIGAVALVFAYSYYKHDLILNMVVALIFGVLPSYIYHISTTYSTTCAAFKCKQRTANKWLLQWLVLFFV